MLELTNSRRLKDEILTGPATHFLGLGYEERCLAYPLALSGLAPRHDQVIFVIDPGDEGVGWVLRKRRRDFWVKLRDLFPSCQRISIDDFGPLLASNEIPSNICLDLSALPRGLILRMLTDSSSNLSWRNRVFVAYSYPERYTYEALETPASSVEFLFPRPPGSIGPCSALAMLGFESSYVILAKTFLHASSGAEVDVRYAAPFPGRQYAFYQRSVESHLDLLEGNGLALYPQDHLLLSLSLLRREILKFRHKPVFLMSFGPRISLVSAYLLAIELRRESIHRDANILYVRTGKYNALRSKGFGATLIEEIPFELLKNNHHGA